MTDIKELKALAEVASEGPWYLENGMNQVRSNGDDFVCETYENEPVNSAFIAAANPTAVLELIAEIERLQHFEVAYKEFGDKTDWVQENAHWSELGMHRADVLRKRCDDAASQLQAQADHLVKLMAENETLRNNAERWQCVRNAVPMKSPYAVWREGSHLVLGRDADELVDNFLSHAKEASQ